MARAVGSAAPARPQAERMGAAIGLSPDTAAVSSVPANRHAPLVWAATAATGVLAFATLVFNVVATTGPWTGLPEPTPLTSERAEIDLPVLTKPVHSAVGRFRGDMPDPQAAPAQERVPAAAALLETPLVVPASPDLPTARTESEAPVRAEAPRPAVAPPASPLAPASPAFAGLWAPKGTACSPRDNRGGYLPAVITADGAFAGETSCAFRRTRAEGGAWVTAATCSSPKGRWSSVVRLSVEGNRLTWSSARGTQSYVRCGNQRAEQAPSRTPRG